MPLPYRRILCPVDLDRHSVEALNEAAAMAMHSGGILQLLHVIEINPLTAEGATEGLAPQELYAAQVESAQKRVSVMLAELPSNVECKVTIPSW